MRVVAFAAVFTVAAAFGAPVHADALDGRSLRVGLGVVWPTSLPVTPFVMAALPLKLWRVSLEPELGFWSRSEVAFSLENATRETQLGLSLTWSRLRFGRARLRLGAGGSAHLRTDSGGPIAGEKASETSASGGLQAWVAVEVPLGSRLAGFAGLRSDWILRSTTDDDRQTRVYAGVRLAL